VNVKYYIHFGNQFNSFLIMRSIEAITGMWGKEIKENDGGGKFNYI
jgi:hypothetical protein